MKQFSFDIIQSGSYVNVDDVQNKSQKTEINNISVRQCMMHVVLKLYLQENKIEV
jgi:hypothetical protein